MELLDGQTLKEEIAAGPLPFERVLELGPKSPTRSGRAHAREIVHRDIKPADIFVTRPGRSKVLDFGLAKARGVENRERPHRRGARCQRTRGVDDQ
jgi:serine/threonine-protein kinase